MANAIWTDTQQDAGGGTIVNITGVSLSGDTITPADLRVGVTAHDANGNAIVGTYDPNPSVDYGSLNRITYNGLDLREYGIFANGNKSFDAPKKNYTKVSVPGRSGDLFIWDGTYSNIDVEYDCILLPTPIFTIERFETKFRRNARSAAAVLLSPEGYVRLEDSYNPDEYRLGVYEGPMDLDAINLSASKVKLKFNCRPERFLTSGETEVDVSSGTESTPYVLNNPTSFSSKPIIRIRQNASTDIVLHINEYEMTIKKSALALVTVIDCETMDCKFSNGSSANSYVVVDEFPELNPGDNEIYYDTTGIFKIIPRWYIL